MKVYQIRYDGEFRVVEAPAYGAAVETWRKHLIAEWKESGDYDEQDENLEPESVELLNDDPVIR